MNVGPCRVADLAAAPEMDALGAEYAAEAQIKGMPVVVNDWDRYALLETAAMLHAWNATLDGRLIGFITLLVSIHARYNVPLCATESWFVTKPQRKTGAGIRLFRLAEAKSLELTGRHPLVSAPRFGDLAQVLPRLGYEEASIVFFKRTPHAQSA